MAKFVDAADVTRRAADVRGDAVGRRVMRVLALGLLIAFCDSLGSNVEAAKAKPKKGKSTAADPCLIVQFLRVQRSNFKLILQVTYGLK